MVKRYRLRKSGDFKAVLDERKSLIKDDSMSVFHRENGMDHARIGLSVSSKLGNAVVRARIKRQVRAQVHLLDIFSIPEDIVIILRKGYLAHTFQENLDTLRKAFSHVRNSSRREQQ